MAIGTLSLGAAISVLMLFIATMVMSRVFMGRSQYLHLWPISAGLLAAGSVLLGLRGILDEELTIIAGNLLVFVGFAILNNAVRDITGHTVVRWLPLATGLVTLLVWLYWTLIEPSYEARVVASSVLLAVFYTSLAVLFFTNRHRGSHTISLITAVVTGAMVPIFLLRAWAAVQVNFGVTRDSMDLLTAMPFLISVAIYAWLAFVMVVTISLNVQDEMRLQRDTIARNNAELRRLALTDSLTGLANRNHLESRLAEAVDAAHSAGMPVSLLLIEIDNFSEINDRIGSLQSDELVTVVGHSLAGYAARSELVGRWGECEFMVIMHNTGASAAAERAMGLRDSMSSLHFNITNPEARQYVGAHCHANVGVATWSSGDSIASLFARADASLNRDKQTWDKPGTSDSEALSTP